MRQYTVHNRGGFAALDRLTAGDPLSLFLMFGSATTAFGNPGQANYVAANMALEALARFRVMADGMRVDVREAVATAAAVAPGRSGLCTTRRPGG